MRSFQSWGRYPRVQHRGVVPVRWRSDPPDLRDIPGLVLPVGCGRSYGDSCLNEGGVLLDARPMHRFIALDEQAGVLRCEAGATLAEILELIVPRGLFVPVVPGTKYVSLGGAIANDIHGKNHHRAGTFGRHVIQFELLRSSGERLICSAENNPDLFRATIGGLGLTGLILWAEIRLKRIPSASMVVERIRFSTLEEFFPLSEAADRDHEYTVAWVDCLARRRSLGRGLLLRGDHAGSEGNPPRGRPRVRVPFDAPSGLLNPLTIRAFNTVYYRFPLAARSMKVIPYEPFFFPLDRVGGWNRMYGSKGFLQYQCVVPFETGNGPIRSILSRVAESREASFLAVLKRFGAGDSPGMLSFPRPGVTLALDLPIRGRRTLEMLQELDEVVSAAGGAVYPAKDARMSAESFQRYFPQWRQFAAFVDPQFSSSFWRRVTRS